MDEEKLLNEEATFDESVNSSISNELKLDIESEEYKELQRLYAKANSKYKLALSSYNDTVEAYNTLKDASPNAVPKNYPDLSDEPVEIDYIGKANQLSKLKNQLRPYATRSELFETLEKMVKLEGDYVKRYLNSFSNIVFQKDFIIDTVKKYSADNYFNNDSVNIKDFSDKIVLSFDDYEISSQNCDFVTDVFVNGVKLSRKLYTEYPSSKKYNFKTGAKRIFIDKTKQVKITSDEGTVLRKENTVNDGDTVSVVVRKHKNSKNFYYTIKVLDDSVNSYDFANYLIGDYNRDRSNLIVYKKNPSENSFKLLADNAFCFVEEDNRLHFNILERVLTNTVYVIINKNHYNEVTVYNNTDLTIDEYVDEVATMRLDFVTDIMIEGAKLPIPVKNSKEVEIYIDGLRLIPETDFVLYNNTDNDENQFINFSGILKPNSEIVMRNKNFGYMQYNSELNQYTGELYRAYPSMDKIGDFDLSGITIPVSTNYVECYVGRRRVDYNHKRVIANSMLKIDNQTCTNNIEIYYDIDLNYEVRKLLSNYYSQNLPVLDQLYNTFSKQVEECWFNNNEYRKNTESNNSNYNSLEIFLGEIYKIVIMTEPSVILYGREPEIKVYGYYQGNDEGILLNDNPELTIEGFDKYVLGNQRIYAYYRGLQTNILVNVIPKQVMELRIITSTNLYILGDNIRDDIKVIAVYEDESEKIITDECSIECSQDVANEAGAASIKVSYSYNNTEFVTATKYVLISDTNDRKIMNVDILSNVTIIPEGNLITLTPYVQFNNTYIQKPEYNCIDMYLEDSNGGFTTKLEDGMILNYDLESTIKVKLTVYTNNTKSVKYEFEDGVSNIISVPVLNNDLSNENRTIIYDNNILKINPDYTPIENAVYYRIKNIEGIYLTLGQNPITDESICFTTISSLDVVIVEFLDKDGVILEQDLFKLKNANEEKETVSGTLYGNSYEGYIVKCSKALLSMKLDDFNFSFISLIDKDGNLIATLDQNGEYDMITDNDIVDHNAREITTNDNIYFHFSDFNTNSGNVVLISNYFFENTTKDDVLYLNIDNCPYLVKLNRPDYVLNKVGYEKVEFFTPDSGEDTIDLYPNLTTVKDGYKLIEVYEARPNSHEMYKWDYNNVNDIPRYVTYDIDNDYSLLVRSNLYGHTIFYFVFVNDAIDYVIYSFNVEIGIYNNRVRVISVNNKEIHEKSYNSFPAVTVRE